MLKYKGHIYNEGDVITGTIKDIPVTGHLSCDGNAYYFCQDEREGSKPEETYGHKFGWVFRVNIDGELTDGVELNPPNSEQLKFSASPSEIFNSRLLKHNYDGTNVEYKYGGFFNLKMKIYPIPHESCKILHDVVVSNRLEDLNEDVRNRVIKGLQNMLKRVSRHYIITVVDKSAANLFFEQDLKFYRVNTYNDANVGIIKNLLIWNI
ncbi:MAG: hypothetical protein ACOC3V_05870 [bacterium]